MRRKSVLLVTIVALAALCLLPATTAGWWDVTYAERYPLIYSGETIQPMAVNGTNVPLMECPIPAAGETLYLYCKLPGCTGGGMAIANDTAEVSWENATAMTGNNPTDVYGDATVLRLHMEETATAVGSTIHDSTRYGVDGSLGADSNLPGLFGRGINFTGNINSNVTLQDSAHIRFYTGGQYTISLWVYPDVFAGDNRCIYCTGETGGGTGSSVLLRPGVDGYFYVFLNGHTTWTQITSTTPIPLNQWSHIALALDFGGTSYGYVNGTIAGSADTSGLGAIDQHTASLGVRTNGENPFRGMIDEVTVFNRTLNVTEISELHDKGRNNRSSHDAAETGFAISKSSPINGSTYDDTNASGGVIDLNFSIAGTADECWYDLNEGAEGNVTIRALSAWDDTEDAAASSGDWTNPTNAYDEDWGTYAETGAVGTHYIYENISYANLPGAAAQLPDVFHYAKFSSSGGTDDFIISFWNYTSSGWVKVWGSVSLGTIADFNTSAGDVILEDSPFQVRTQAVAGEFYYYESKTRFSYIGNTTITAAQGLNNLTLYCNDTSGNLATDYETFTYIGPVDTCTPPASGTWELDCADNCTWTTNQTVPGNVTSYGAGFMNLSAYWDIPASDWSMTINTSACTFYIWPTGGFT